MLDSVLFNLSYCIGLQQYTFVGKPVDSMPERPFVNYRFSTGCMLPKVSFIWRGGIGRRGGGGGGGGKRRDSLYSDESQ